MKALVALLLLASSAAAQTVDLAKDADMRGAVQKVVGQTGANCPVPTRISSVGEDIRGKIDRVDCQSRDGGNVWSIRLIRGRNGSRAEPW